MSKKKLIYLQIKENPSISNKELSEILDCSSKTIYRYIKELKDEGIVERIGSDKSGKWKIIECIQ